MTVKSKTSIAGSAHSTPSYFSDAEAQSLADSIFPVLPPIFQHVCRPLSDDSFRFDLRFPRIIDGQVYATNGWVLVRMHADPKINGLCTINDRLGRFPDVVKMIQGLGDYQAIPVDLPEIPNEMICAQCNGLGRSIGKCCKCGYIKEKSYCGLREGSGSNYEERMCIQVHDNIKLSISNLLMLHNYKAFLYLSKKKPTFSKGDDPARFVIALSPDHPEIEGFVMGVSNH